jgi:threonine-phosphate decarboxylase
MSDEALDSKSDYSGLLAEYDNLFIVNSLTKFLAMPGIRMGYVLSNPDNISKIMKQLPEWNLSVPAQAAINEGMKLISQGSFIRETVDTIKAERAYLMRMLRDFGLEVFDSNTAFILFKGRENLYQELLKKEILIRDCSDYVGLGKGYYRIAVKNHEENETLVEALRGIIHEL